MGRILLKFSIAVLSLILVATALALAVFIRVAPDLPSVEALANIQLQTPLRVYDKRGRLIGRFGEKRRIPVGMDEVPPVLVNAFLAAEDDEFFEHAGIDYMGLLRAAVKLIETGEKRQGGSTITMQLARNFFLGNERTYERKIKEIFLALLIERRFSKSEILSLYLNKIFFGHQAYGIGAAAQVYYGKTVGELELAEMAMLAALPKAPSRYSPIRAPARAGARRNYVLDRMLKLGMIDAAQHREHRARPLTAAWRSAPLDLDAPYIAEMARQEMVERYGDAAYTGGFEAHVTADGDLQAQAQRSLQSFLIAYDVRHGYRKGDATAADLDTLSPLGGLVPARIAAVSRTTATAVLRDGALATLGPAAYTWARAHISANRRGLPPAAAGEVLSAGDIVWLLKDQDGVWRLRQLPAVEGALLAMDPQTGALLAVAGGFDFAHSKFNRAVQAKRQPGSSFKPFIYSAALRHGWTPASMVVDSPVVFSETGGNLDWRPSNYSRRFFGPTRLREALANSRNLVSVKLVDSIGVREVLDHILRFGFARADQPYNLTIALGSGAVTPLQLAVGYAAFANGGFAVRPYLLAEVRRFGELVHRARPLRLCVDDCARAPDEVVDGGEAYAPRIIPSDIAYQITGMLQEVVRNGTGRRARVLKRGDVAGKTGTTNDQRDAWFSGFVRDMVAVAWVGFDAPRSLGRRETGSAAALPMWLDFMKAALRETPAQPYYKPDNIVSASIDPRTGLLAHPRATDSIVETFRAERLPKEIAPPPEDAPQQLDENLKELF